MRFFISIAGILWFHDFSLITVILQSCIYDKVNLCFFAHDLFNVYDFHLNSGSFIILIFIFFLSIPIFV